MERDNASKAAHLKAVNKTIATAKNVAIKQHPPRHELPDMSAAAVDHRNKLRLLAQREREELNNQQPPQELLDQLQTGDNFNAEAFAQRQLEQVPFKGETVFPAHVNAPEGAKWHTNKTHQIVRNLLRDNPDLRRADSDQSLHQLLQTASVQLTKVTTCSAMT